MRVERQTVTTNSGDISCLLGGAGEPLLFLHGIPGSAAAWLPVLHELDGREGRFRVVAPDLLGFGSSGDAIDLHAEAQAAAMLELLDHLGLERVTVVAHDFGGPVALRMYGARPQAISGILLAATNAFGDTPIPFPLSTIFWPLVGRLNAAVVFSPLSLRLMVSSGVGTPAPTIDSRAYVGNSRQAASIRTIFETSLRELATLYGPLAEILAGITVPSRVVWGTRDPFFSVEHGRRTADAIPGSRFRVLEGAGHFLPAERPVELVEEISALCQLIGSTSEKDC